jgi:type II secretory pathway predicted ATPase ExeA
MTQNRYKQRDALFESPGYLADVLSQCAFIEKNFYHEGNPSIKDDLGNALVKLYGAILRYAAQIRDAHRRNVGKKVLDSINASTVDAFRELKASIEKEMVIVFRWTGLVEHLHCQKKAEDILSQIDNIAKSMNDLTEQFRLADLRVAEGACYDSYIAQHRGFCLEQTRSELLEQIRKWAESTEGRCIFWLNGMAGTGKSTIARTVAKMFDDKAEPDTKGKGQLGVNPEEQHGAESKGKLGATFFFERGETDRGNAKYLIPTIIKQLVERHRRLAPDVLNAIKNDPSISFKNLNKQFQTLLLQPLSNLHFSQPTTYVIVIDALDECDQKDIEEILRLLFELQNFRSVRLRIFLTSRPELPIRLGFKQNNNHQVLVLHELPKKEIENDISVFLKHRFSDIRNKSDEPDDWPGDEILKTLVTMATPLFSFADMACRFIGECVHPGERLEQLLKFKADTSASQMGKVYEPVLNQLLYGANDKETNQLKKEFQDIVGAIILFDTPLSIKSLEQLLQIRPKVISELLRRLHSVLNIPGEIDDPVRILHASFRDYLLSKECPFYVDKKATHAKITLHCLDVMKNLKDNICGLSSYGIQRSDINDQVIKQHFSAELRYSCRYWVSHFHQSEGHVSESDILSFLKDHFLHWLEALSLIGIASEAVGFIDKLKSDVWVSLCMLYS